MDYWMSKLNGATACRNILAKNPSARVILVSGWSHLTDLHEAGAVRVLSKPVDIEQLEDALNTAYTYSPASANVVESNPPNDDTANAWFVEANN
jgi:DNA-binding NarL/FixJ family response regulator